MIFKNFFLILCLMFGILISDDANIDKSLETSISEKNPELAWKLSLIPGLGQFYNEKYLKGALFLSSEAILIRNISIYSADIAMRNSLMWLTIGIYVFNIIDAYVDAELSTFSQNKDKE